MKKAYEQFYPDGYFVTKRGEKVDSVKYNTAHVVNLTDLGKQLIAWHSQRPNLSYGETKILINILINCSAASMRLKIFKH